MATANYDELVHSAGSVVTDWNSIDPLYKWDTHFPERLSRLSVTPDYAGVGGSGGAGTGSGPPQRRQKRGRNRNTSRFKTQPITFDEIKEVDEEPRSAEEVKEGLKNQFAAFSRSMDGLVPGFPILPPCLRKQHAAEQQGMGMGGSSASYSPCPAFPAGTTTISMVLSQPTASNGCDIMPNMAAGAASGDLASAGLRAQEEAAVFAAVGLNPTLANVQDVSRARRKKRRSRKSIEEEPELEKIAAANLQSSG